MHRTFTTSTTNSRVFIACLLSFMTLIAPMASVGAATRRGSTAIKKQAATEKSTSQFAPAPVAAPLPKPAPAPLLAPIITATKIDSFADSDGDGKAEPGETITYTTTISNTGPDPATHLKFIDTIDSHTTLVPGSINSSPLANPDSYTASGNIQISIPAGSGVLLNDFDPDNGSNSGLTITQVQGSGANVGIATDTTATGLGGVKGSVTLASNGSFTYEPPPGFEGADTFTYTISDGTTTSTGTVTINISAMVWFIQNNAGGSNRGTFSNPFTSIASFNTANGGAGVMPAPKNGDFISLRTGTGTYSEADGVNLRAQQKLIGNAIQFNTVFTASTNSSAAYVTFAGAAGSAPSIVTSAGNGVDLSTDNTVRGLNIGNTPGFFGINGAAVGSPIINTIAVTGTGGAINVSTSGAFGANVTFSTLESSSSPGSNINLVGVTGTLGVTSGGAGLTGSTTNGVTINGGSVTLNYPGNITKSTGGSLVNVLGGHSLGTLSFPGTLSATAGDGVQFNNADGTYTFNGTATFNGGDAGIDITNGSAGAFSFNANSSITNPTNDLVLISGGTQNFTYSGSFSKTTGTRGMFIQNNTGGTILFNGSGVTKTITTTGANNAIDLDTNTGTIINFTNNNLLLTSATGSAFEATGGGTITVQGTGNTLTSTTGTALNVANTLLGLAGLTFLSINSNGGTNGIVLNTVGTTAGVNGGLTVSGTGTTAGSGGTIQNKVQGAVITSSRDLVMKNMTFTNANTADGTCNNIDGPTFNNACQAAINITTITNATFDNMAMNGGTQVGLNGQTISGLSILNSTIQNFGNEASENNVRLFNVSGTATITNSNFSFAGGVFPQAQGETLVDIRNNTGALTLNVLGSPLGTNFNNFTQTQSSANGSFGLSVTTVSSASATVNVMSSKFLNIRTAGIATFARDTSTMNVNITGGGTVANGNTFDPSLPLLGRAIDLNAEDTAQLFFNINENPKIYGAGGPIINIFGINNAQIQGHIRNNPDIRGGGAASPGSPIYFHPEDSADGRVHILNNVISNVGQDQAILLLNHGNGAALLDGIIDAIVQSNTINLATAGANNSAIYLNSGANVGDVNKVCGFIQNNSVTTALASQFAFVTFTGSAGSNVYLQNFSVDINGTWTANGNSETGPGSAAIAGGANLPLPAAGNAPFNGTCRAPTNAVVMAAPFSNQREDWAQANPSAPNKAVESSAKLAPAFTKVIAGVSAKAVATTQPVNTQVNTTVRPIEPVRTASTEKRSAQTFSHHAVRSARTAAAKMRTNIAPLVLAGETVTIDGGAGVAPPNSGFTLGAGQSFTVTFQVTVNNPPNLTFPYVGGSPQVSNQGTVTADGGISVLTDDPAVGGASDPTVTPVDLFNSQTTVAAVPTAGTTSTSITLTATVKLDPAQVPTPAVDTDPTGTVRFQDNGVDIAGCTAQPLTGTANPNESTATCTTTFTPSGTHPITAIYSADGNYDASTSGAQNVTIIDPPTIAKSFIPATTALNSTATMRFVITNPNTTTALSGIAFSDTTPAGITVPTAGPTAICGGSLQTTSPSTVSFTGGTLAGAANCQIDVTVTGITAGDWPNTSGAVSSTETGAGATSNQATLTVVAPPVIAKAFAPANTSPGGSSVLTFTITNPVANTVALTGVSFTDTFPAGIQVAAVPNVQPAANQCGAGSTVMTTGGVGTSSVTLSGGSIVAGGQCIFTVDVTATTGGLNQVTVNSTNGGTGNTASATLTTCIAPPQVANMVAWWTGDNTPRDIAGGNDGVLNGNATYAAGKVLQGFSLDGTGDFVEAPDSNSLDMTTAITIDAWINPTTANANGRIVDKITPGNTDGYLLDLVNGALRFTVGSNSSQTVITIPANTFSHVAATYDGVNVMLYFNGVSVATTPTTGAIPVNALPLRIGADQAGNFGFTGVIDEVEVFNVALTAAQVLALNDAGAGGKCKVSDLRVTKADTTDPFDQGSTGNYTITVHNDGPADTSGTVTVTDTLPAGLTYNSFTGTGWSCNGAVPPTVTCTSSQVVTSGNNYDLLTITVNVAANVATSVNNTVTVSGGGELDTSDDSDTETTALRPVADLQITKTDGSPSEIPGTAVTYTITVTNAGPSNVTGASVADTFPGTITGVTYTSVAAGGATGNTAAGVGNIADTVDMPSGSTITYTATGTIVSSATGSVSNTATVTAPAGVLDAGGNNSATDTDTLSVVADLSITKDDGATDEVPGTAVTYTITVTNGGPSDVTGATVADTFPGTITGVTYTSVVTGGATGNTSSTGNINDTVNMPAGSTITYTATGTISASATGSLSNTATVTAPGGVTDAGGNNSATDTDTLTPGADLSITKDDGATTEIPGTGITYTITVTNGGPSDVTGATVADTFPGTITGVTYTSVTSGGATGNTSSTGNINDTVNMPSGSTITYTATGTISAAASGSLSNTATVTAPAGVTDTAGNNSATDTDTLVTTADLSITKDDGTGVEVPGTTVTYTIVVTNNGPSNVTGASVADTFPATITGVTYTSVAGGGATGNTAAGAGNIADTVDMPLGSTITYTATGTIAASATGSLSNTATVTAPGGVTDAGGNNSATDTDTLIGSADLSVTKTDTPDPVAAGSNITYTISFINNGPSDAQTVTVTDGVPADTTFVSATPHAGWSRTDAVPVGGTGNIVFAKATVAAGETATFTVVVKVNSNVAAASTISNTVTAASATADGTPADNSDTETTTVVTSADLLLVKTESVDPVAAGANLTYTITVTNGGSSDAQTLSLSDTLPAFTTLVSFTVPGGWTRTDVVPVGGTGTVTATTPTLVSGASAVFTLVVNVNLATPHGTVLSNTATVTTATTDPDTTNNSSTVTTTVIALPDAFDDAYFGLKDQVFNIPAPGVLSNDTGPTLAVTPVVGGATTAGGSYTINADGSFTYTPPAGFSGTDGFDYTVTNPAGSDTAHVELTVTDPATIALRISEFRFNGPNGATDEFFEIYNASPTAHQVGGTSLSNSGGYGLFASAGNGVTSNTVTLVCLIPNGTIIPARGYILCTGSNYSLAALGTVGSSTGSATIPVINGSASTSVGNFPIINGTVAHPGAYTSTDVPNDAGLVLANVGTNTVGASSDVGNGNFGFNATGVAAGNFKVWDRVGFAPYGAGAPLQPCHLTNVAGCGASGSARPSLADNYCEGGATGCLRPVGDASTTNHGTAVFYGDSGQYSLLRRQTVDQSATIGTVPQDTANNSDDFVMVSPTPGINIAFTITNFPTGVTNGLVSVLGAAGPQNNAAPADLAETRLQSSLFDPSRTSAQLPNAERRYVLDNTLTTINNNPQGSFIFRFGFRNMSAASDINRLRFRIDNLSVLCGQTAPPAGTGVVGSGNARNLHQTSPNCQGTDNKTAILKMLNMPTEFVAPENGPAVTVRGSVIEDTDGTKLAPNGGGINNSLVRTGTAPGSLTGEFTTVVPAGGPGPRFYIGFRMGVVKGGSFRFLFQPEGSSTIPVPAPTVP